MEPLTYFLSDNLLLVALGLAAAGAVWLTVLSFLAWRTLKFSQSLFGDTKKEDLKEILQEHIGRVGSVQMRVNDLEKHIAQLDHRSQKHLAKVGVVRFNPFDDTGGDQSFAIALLDEEDNGLVISSLHGRQRTRVYAKMIRAGDSMDYDFSEEEKEAIRKARALGHK